MTCSDHMITLFYIYTLSTSTCDVSCGAMRACASAMNRVACYSFHSSSCESHCICVLYILLHVSFTIKKLQTFSRRVGHAAQGCGDGHRETAAVKVTAASFLSSGS